MIVTSPIPTSADEVRSIIRQEVETQIDKETRLLKSSVALAAKILAFAVAVFVGIFAFLGWTTWRDIKSEAISIVNSQTEGLLKQSDSDLNVKAHLLTLVNRAVAASSLTAIARAPNFHNLKLSDWERLQAWLKYEDLPLTDFVDVLTIFNAQSKSRKIQDANRFLAEMLNPPERSPLLWILKQPEKRQAILKHFKENSLGAGALDLATSAATTQALQLLAIKYLEEVAYKEGVERLLTTYSKTPSGPVKRATLLTCLALRPTSTMLTIELQRLMAEVPSLDNNSVVVEVLQKLLVIGDLDASDMQAYNNLSNQILMYLVTNGTTLSFQYRGTRRVGNSVRADSWNLPYIQIYQKMAPKSFSGVFGFDLRLLIKYDPYWRAISNAADLGNVELLSKLVPAQGLFTPPPLRLEYFSIQAGSGASVTVLEDGLGPVTLDLATLNAPKIAGLAGDTQKIILSWYDLNGTERTARLLAMKGTKYRFSFLTQNRVFASDATPPIFNDVDDSDED